MSQPISAATKSGSWVPLVDSSDVRARWNRTLGVVAVALVAIGSFVAGTLLRSRDSRLGWYLIGAGGALAVSDLIVMGYLVYQRHAFNMRHQNRQGNYHVVSWNVAAWSDYSNICAMKREMGKNQTFTAARDALLTGTFQRASHEEREERRQIFRRAFQQFGNPDIICLQESSELDRNYLTSVLPPGYAFFSYQNESGRECTLVWKAAKFALDHYAQLTYDPEQIRSFNSNPDTIGLLRDRTNGAQICVGSIHLRGFSLAAPVPDKALAGDNQARYTLDTMAGIQADVYIFAGDLNATREHYLNRFQIIEQHKYNTDEADVAPTIYDASLKESDNKTPKAVKLDYIFARGSDRTQVQIHQAPLQNVPLMQFAERASDHLPVAATIQFALCP